MTLLSAPLVLLSVTSNLIKQTFFLRWRQAATNSPFLEVKELLKKLQISQINFCASHKGYAKIWPNLLFLGRKLKILSKTKNFPNITNKKSSGVSKLLAAQHHSSAIATQIWLIKKITCWLWCMVDDYGKLFFTNFHEPAKIIKKSGNFIWHPTSNKPCFCTHAVSQKNCLKDFEKCAKTKK